MGDLSAPYPDPVPFAQAERLVDQMIERGWNPPFSRAEAITLWQRKLRLKNWIRAMGVQPTEDNRRAYVEKMRLAHYESIRATHEKKGDKS